MRPHGSNFIENGSKIGRLFGEKKKDERKRGMKPNKFKGIPNGIITS
jgi:hypothetical protein